VERSSIELDLYLLLVRRRWKLVRRTFAQVLGLKGSIVQRLHLNLRQGEILVAPDHEGAEFASIEEAFLEAFRGAQELWSELLRDRQDPRRYAYEITDARGVILMEVPFVEILESCRPVRPMRAGERPRHKKAILDRNDFLIAMENARKLKLQSAELMATLHSARQSLEELRDCAKVSLKQPY
jgi:hypothetical protein